MAITKDKATRRRGLSKRSARNGHAKTLSMKSNSAHNDKPIPGEILRWAAEHVTPPACSNEVDELPFDTAKATRVHKPRH